MSKNGVLLVLFLILAVNLLAVFSIVVDKRGDDNGNDKDKDGETVEISEEDGDVEEGDENNENNEQDKEDGEIDEGLFIDKVKAQDQTQTSKWVATDYAPGDITTNFWTVQSGDTLWEISEARYGSGLKWINILDQNRSSIGRLPNGQQALIFPGQVLSLK